MPTYVCHADRGSLSAGHKAALADRVTAVHRDATGAPASFVQVLFTELAPGDHFIGGRPVPAAGVHLHGHIREGRSPQVRRSLTEGLCDAVVAVTGLPADLVWVYVSEIPADQMVEFGRVLPPPGDEQKWIDALPAPVRERLRGLDG